MGAEQSKGEKRPPRKHLISHTDSLTAPPVFLRPRPREAAGFKYSEGKPRRTVGWLVIKSPSEDWDGALLLSRPPYPAVQKLIKYQEPKENSKVTKFNVSRSTHRGTLQYLLTHPYMALLSTLVFARPMVR